MLKRLKNSKLEIALLSLDAKEHLAFRKFLQSPFFNQREDVLKLYDFIKKQLAQQQPIEGAAAWAFIFPEKAYKAATFRLIGSYLFKLLQQFLVVQTVPLEGPYFKRKLTTIWRDQTAEALRAKAIGEAERQLERAPLRDASFHHEAYLLWDEKYRLAYQTKPEAGHHLEPLDQALNLAFIALKLRKTCLLLAHAKVYKLDFQPSLVSALFTFIEQQGLLKYPAVSIYYYCIKMQQEEDASHNFQQFKSVLLAHGQHFEQAELRDLHKLAINFAIKQVNDGHRAYFVDIMDFYEDGLENRYLIENGRLSRFTYHNIVAVALQLKRTDWAEHFIQEWTRQLDPRFKERMESFNRAKIAYAKKEYTTAIGLLQRSNYHDLLLNLGARALLLKIYVELDEYEALDSHLEAFQSYLTRKAALGYHRTNYRKLIYYTKKILQLAPSAAKARAQLQERIEAEPILTEKTWLLEQLACRR